MLVTMEMIFDKLVKIEKEIKQLQDHELEIDAKEYSLNKAAGLLGIGQKKLLRYIKSGLIKARLDKNEKSISGWSYRFTHTEIRRFQKDQQVYSKPELQASNVHHIFDAKSIINNYHKTQKVNNG